MEKLRIVVCDEHESEAKHYVKLCRGICQEWDVPAEFKIYTNAKDFLFDMGEEAFSSLLSILILEPAGGFEAISTTVRQQGYDGMILYLSHSSATEYMLEGYDTRAYNYVMKGDDEDRFNRFVTVFSHLLQSARKLDRQYIVLNCAGEYRQIEIGDIYYFEGATARMISVVYADGSFRFVSTLRDLEERMADRGFIRVHRSYLVLVDAIRDVLSNELTLKNGQTIPVSRNYAALKAALERRKA